MGILAWIIFGLLAGVVARFLVPGNDPGGWIVTIILGIVGAVVGGFIGNALGYGGIDGFNLGSFVLAVIGSVILLVGYRMLSGRRVS